MSISIVTISFNQAKYLQECIASVANQEVESLQYIVVDPGSNDESRDIIDANTENIDTVIYEKDHGPSDGLNKGFAAATGEIYGYINADDRFVPGALPFVECYFQQNPDIDILCGAIRIIDDEGKPSIRKRNSDLFCLPDYMAGICTVGQQATFFRKEAFRKAGGFNSANRITWDGELLVDMALAGCKFATVKKVLGEFRIYPDSITGSKKFLDKQKEEFARINAKLRARNIGLYGDLETRIRRIVYKANIGRHLGYLIVR